jgi:hypothetical protein
MEPVGGAGGGGAAAAADDAALEAAFMETLSSAILFMGTNMITELKSEVSEMERELEG